MLAVCVECLVLSETVGSVEKCVDVLQDTLGINRYVVRILCSMNCTVLRIVL